MSPERSSAVVSPNAAAPPRIMVIGVGSVIFGLAFLQDFFRCRALAGATLWLVDTDPAALDRMSKLAHSLNAVSGMQIDLRAESTVSDVHDVVDYVVCAAAVDRDRRWKADHALAIELGFPSVLSENAGPGGLSHTLRSIPLVVSLAREVEAQSPQAVFLNYTNPENRVLRAVTETTGLRVVGLCHGVAESTEWLADTLAVPRSDLHVRVAGVNHLTWLIAASLDGVDQLPVLRGKFAENGVPEYWRFCAEEWNRSGLFPLPDDRHVGEFFPDAAAVVGTAGYDFTAFSAKRIATAELASAAAGDDRRAAALMAEPSYEGAHGHSSPDLIAAIHHKESADRPSFIIRNDGFIENLPPGAVVEVTGRVIDGAVSGYGVGHLPEPAAEICRWELQTQELAVSAALTGDRSLALEALVRDPVTTDRAAAEVFLDRILSRDRDILERFQ